MSVSNNGKLFGRIASVMAAVRKLPEDGYNSHDKYKYTTAATAVEFIGKAMAENGLVIVPVITAEATNKPNGEKAFFSTVEVDFHVCDVDGNAFVSHWVGQGVNYRTTDKALKTALTNANTTFLLKLFQVGAGEDDPELDSDTEPRQKPAQSRSNGTPPHSQPAAEVTTTDQAAVNQRYSKAKDWAMKSGKFNARKHMENAWAKLFAEYEAHVPQNADAFLSAWKEYVDNHEPAETSQPVAA